MAIWTAPYPVSGRDWPFGIDFAPGTDSLLAMCAECSVSIPPAGRDFDPPRGSLP